MFEHKQPGKTTHTGHGPTTHGHVPGPGKQTLTEQAGHGAIASAAAFDPPVSASKSATVTLHEGPMKIDTTVALSVAHGKGPISLDLHSGGFSVGNDHLAFDMKTSGPATGKSLGLNSVSATVSSDGTHKTTPTITADGYLSTSYSTTYTIKLHGWSATLSVTSVIGTQQAPPKHPHGIGKIIHAVEHIAGDVVKDMIHTIKAIVNSAPHWGPALEEALAAAAAVGAAIVVVG